MAMLTPWTPTILTVDDVHGSDVDRLNGLLDVLPHNGHVRDLLDPHLALGQLAQRPQRLA